MEAVLALRPYDVVSRGATGFNSTERIARVLEELSVNPSQVLQAKDEMSSDALERLKKKKRAVSMRSYGCSTCKASKPTVSGNPTARASAEKCALYQLKIKKKLA